MSGRDRFGCIIILCCFALTQFSLALYLPILPVLTAVFHANAEQLILSLSTTTAGYGVGQLVWGSLSDKIGRRPVYILSLIAYFVVCGLLINTIKLSAFYVNMALLGFCAASFTSVGNAFIVDLFGIKRAKIGIGYVGIMMASASVLNPLIGSHLQAWFNWQAVFIFLLIYAFVMLIGIIKVVRETHDKTQEAEDNLLAVYRKLLTHPHYVGYLLTLGISFGCFFTYLAAAPFIYRDILNVTLTQYGWLFLLSSITYVIGSIFVTNRIQYWGTNKLLTIGLRCFLLGGILLLLVTLFGIANRYSIIIPVAIFLFGVGVAVPASKAGAMTVFETHRGTAASLMKFTQIFLTTIITAIAAKLHVANSINLLGIMMVVIALISLIAIKLFVLRRVSG